MPEHSDNQNGYPREPPSDTTATKPSFPIEIEAVLFDLDGTLIDYETLSHDTLEKPIKDRGFGEVSWDLHGSIVGMKHSDWSRIILEKVGITADKSIDFSPEEYDKEVTKLVLKTVDRLKPWPRVENVLEFFTKELGVPIAIATSSTRECFVAKMELPVMQEKVMKYFGDGSGNLTNTKWITTGDEITNGKPAPDIFLESAKRLGVDPTKCLVFEDSPHGIKAGQAAGCYTVALPDERFLSVTKGKFDALEPTFSLPGGIGSFLDEIVQKGLVRKCK